MNASRRSRGFTLLLSGLLAFTLLLGGILVRREIRLWRGTPAAAPTATKAELARSVVQSAPDETPGSSLELAADSPPVADAQVQEPASISPGMTKDQMLARFGAPVRQKNTVMADGIYGVSDQMEKKIGFGNRFEMWEYEQGNGSKRVYTTVWFRPDLSASGEQMRVVDVTTQVVINNPYLKWLGRVGKQISALWPDE